MTIHYDNNIILTRTANGTRVADFGLKRVTHTIITTDTFPGPCLGACCSTGYTAGAPNSPVIQVSRACDTKQLIASLFV